MKKYGWIGSLAKAEMKDSKPHLVFLATGPELDKQGERITKSVLDKVEAAAKAGKMSLCPSHDTPIQLATSTDAWSDEAGHVFVDFAVDAADPLAMKTFKGYESGSWTPTVSLGAEKVTRSTAFEFGKAITEISDIEVDDPERPVHLALAFPSRNVYPLAGVTQALYKAMKHDPSELKKRLWPEESLLKAFDAEGNWIPPSFGERWAKKEIEEDLPDMMDLLRWCIEDIVSPYTVGTVPEKRAKVVQSVNEFLDEVLGTVTEPQAAKAEQASGGMAKAAPVEGAEPSQEPAKPPQQDAPAPASPPTPEASREATAAEQSEPEEAPATKALRAELDKVKGGLEALQKAFQAQQPPDPNAGRTTDPATAPHTGIGLPGQAAVDATEAKKALQERLDTLRKAINSTPDASRKSSLIQEHGALLAELTRM